MRFGEDEVIRLTKVMQFSNGGRSQALIRFKNRRKHYGIPKTTRRRRTRNRGGTTTATIAAAADGGGHGGAGG